MVLRESERWGEVGGGCGDWTGEESAVGGTDVRSLSGTAAASADHLVVMVHGILGSTDNWKFAAYQFVSMLPDKVVVHYALMKFTCICFTFQDIDKLTLDGVDVMGERLAEEVIEVVNKKPNLRKISFIAHSVGGLVARYAIGRLHRAPRREPLKKPSSGPYDGSLSTIYCLEAMNLITIATPHLGSRGNKQVPFLFGVTAMEKVASWVIHWIFGKTGKHLFLTDEDEGKLPLLQRMVDDCDDLQFMSALQAFRRRVVYSNVGYDHIVGWRTSSIRRNSELPKWENSLSEKYPHIVYEECATSTRNDECTDDALVIDDYCLLEEKLVTGLASLSWEKVDVSFHNSGLQRFAAHSVIQVKDPFMHIEGADVIQHMIDHFLT